MSNKILIKRGSGAPTTSDLDNYEIAYDTGANKLYIRDGSDIIPFAAIVDEDNFASNDANRVPSQQSTKAYIASELAAAGAGDITAVNITAGTGLSGSVNTSSGAHTQTLSVSGLTVSELAAGSLTTSSESFADNDTTLMTSAAINDRITSFNYLTAHPSISAASTSNNSGRTYIQDITLDSNGHVTGIATATETVTNTDTNTNQLTTFQLEDGDGTEVTVSHAKEVKFVEGGRIDINWTDVSNGTDGDPYDLTFTVDSNLANYDNSSSGFLTTVNLASNVGATILPVANGGTGASTLTDGGILLGSGTGAITAMAVLAPVAAAAAMPIVIGFAPSSTRAIMSNFSAIERSSR